MCQTCLPCELNIGIHVLQLTSDHSSDAEGNGDSISAAVQAERIALLTSVLSQTGSSTAPLSPAPHALRSQSLTPPYLRRPFIDLSPPFSRGSAFRSQSHLDLNAQYAQSRPIYQTSGNRQPSPLYSTGPPQQSQHHHLPVYAPAPLLPSFLQDIVQVPALSPTSTSSADLSVDDYEDSPPSSARPIPHTRIANDSANNLPLPMGNIWRLDGEESKSLSAFALPNHQDLVGSSRKSSQERLHLHVITN